jgi:RNA polymerase sigma-70 factor (ECF subfamily)
MPSQPPQPEDARLVSRALEGDTEAFAMLFDRYARLVRALAWDAGHDWAVVQDLTQECFLRAYRHLASLRKPEHFRYWLTGIARQLVRETRRRRLHEHLDEEDAVAGAETKTLDDSDEIEHVLGLVARLPEQERQAIRCFFLCERNIADTAQFLDLSRSGAYEVIKRACSRLARWMGVCEPDPPLSEGRCRS